MMKHLQTICGPLTSPFPPSAKRTCSPTRPTLWLTLKQPLVRTGQEVLCAVHVPLPVGVSAYGARPGVCHERLHGSAVPDERIQGKCLYRMKGYRVSDLGSFAWDYCLLLGQKPIKFGRLKRKSRIVSPSFQQFALEVVLHEWIRCIWKDEGTCYSFSRLIVLPVDSYRNQSACCARLCRWRDIVWADFGADYASFYSLKDLYAVLGSVLF